MTYASIGYQIFQQVQGYLRAASLVGIDPANILIRELPKVDEVLDGNPPWVFICSHQSIGNESLNMEGTSGRTYSTEIALIDGSEGDFATNQQARQTWHEQVMDALDRDSTGQFRNRMPGVPSVWGTQIREVPTIDRSKLNQNYAYFSVIVDYLSAE